MHTLFSYYLNSHHIDFHCWALDGRAVPYKVTASASRGVATSAPYELTAETEDTISLLVNWRSTTNHHEGVAVYTSTWIAPNNSEVHSQQRFHYLGAGGEIQVDQAHRGYTVTTDDAHGHINPFYMNYAPDEEGHFGGQSGYGFVSIEKFVDACNKFNANPDFTLADLESRKLPTIRNTVLVTAILEAGRRSLDKQKPIHISQDAQQNWVLED